MNTGKKNEVRGQQALRRLSELEVAARLGGGVELAWHIMQARRSGASLPEIKAAVEPGMKMRGTPAAALTQCADDLIWLCPAGDTRWSNRELSVGMLRDCS